MALVDAGADAVKVGIGRARSAPLASWRASACRRSRGRQRGRPRSRRTACRSSPMAASLLGRRGQGDRRRGLLRDDRQPVRRTEESPGEVELYQGASYKSYRGMGSLAPWPRRTDRATATSRTPPPSSRSSCRRAWRAACPTRAASSRSCTSSRVASAPRWATPAAAASRRCAPAEVRAHHRRWHAREPRHDVTITKEAPNYRVS